MPRSELEGVPVELHVQPPPSSVSAAAVEPESALFAEASLAAAASASLDTPLSAETPASVTTTPPPSAPASRGTPPQKLFVQVEARH